VNEKQNWYMCFVISGGFEIANATRAEAEEIANMPLADLLEQGERPVAKVLLSPLRDSAD
jgi:hypothetical protein